MSATIATTHRLELIKDITDGQFRNVHDVVLLACPQYPIITTSAQQYANEPNIYPDTKAFLDQRLKNNHNSLDQLATELGFSNARMAFDFAYDAINNRRATAINQLLAQQYGAVYLKSLVKIAILASTASLDEIAKLARIAGKQDSPSGLLLYLTYAAGVDHPMSYQHAVQLATNHAHG